MIPVQPGHNIYVTVYEFPPIPHWMIWAAGMTPFALACVAWLKHFEQLWWISITLIAEFIGLGLGVEAYLRNWSGMAWTLGLLAVSCGTFLYGQRPRRRR